jgi:ubiquinone/menaquinone biosynthesis C-methylase UbiE
MSTFRQRFFAWLFKKGDVVNNALYQQVKQELFKDVSGTVLEIGPGTGINFLYLPNNINWIGLEPNKAFHKTILSAASKANIKATLLNASAQNIDMPDESADVIISTLVLCSVPNQQEVLQEIKRVLKKGGKLIFIEHVADKQGSNRRRVQNLLNPVNRIIADGCNCNRETWQEIEKANFSSINILHTLVQGAMFLHAPHIIGYAIR